MTHLIPTAKKLVVGVVAVGALALGTAGIAGAATTGSSTTPAVTRHINCANADRVLTRIQAGEARISAGLPKLTAAEAAATKAGDTKLANRLEKRITRLESSTFKARLAKVTSVIEAKCPGSAPSSAS